jgi:hypothetical protein
MSDKYYFSVLRWRSDPTRDEARNVAVVLVEQDGTSGGIRAAPISTISPTLGEQGLLDEVVASIERRFANSDSLGLEELEQIRSGLQRSIYFTEPRAVSVSDIDSTLGALYAAYARPRMRSNKGITKGQALDRVVTSLRHRGWDVVRAKRVEDVLFDLVIENPNPAVGSVLSFASGASDVTKLERDAGHFLYGRDRTQLPGLAYLQPPDEAAADEVREAHRRIVGWYRDSQVEVRSVAEVAAKPKQETLALVG